MPRHLVISCLALAAFLPTSRARTETSDEPRRNHRLHLELDPLPFARNGFGVQPGIRFAQLPAVRFAIGNFALDVPDFVTELGDNPGFHARVRHGHALYILYFPQPSDSGWAVGGSLRYLNLRYTYDDVPDERTTVHEVAVEAIAGYKWHPFAAGFYVIPWLAIGRPIVTSGDVIVGSARYDALPVQLFATMNIGWEFEL